jgi:hypothetical protein
MRRMLLPLTLSALALGLAPGVSSGQGIGGGGADQTFCAPAGPPARGQCSFASGQVTFDFDASSGPLGENPMGSGIFVVFPGEPGEAFADYDITCLQVTRNRASFGGLVTNSNFMPVGSGIAFSVLDNTPGPDLISNGTQLFDGPPAANTPSCGDVFQPETPWSRATSSCGTPRCATKPRTSRTPTMTSARASTSRRRRMN